VGSCGLEPLSLRRLLYLRVCFVRASRPEEERGLEPHTHFEVRSAFEAGPAPSRFFFRLPDVETAGRPWDYVSISRWSVRESNPLRGAFQTPALPIELTDQGKEAVS
jgi:hypothetical protein